MNAKTGSAAGMGKLPGTKVLNNNLIIINTIYKAPYYNTLKVLNKKIITLIYQKYFEQQNYKTMSMNTSPIYE